MRHPPPPPASCVLFCIAALTSSAFAAVDIELVRPGDGDRDQPRSIRLQVRVESDRPIDKVEFFGERRGSLLDEAGEEFTVIVVPDTQIYARSFPETFKAQMRWIVDSRRSRNIVFVSHVGDIVDDALELEQWNIADRELGRLDGVVPYGVLPGNHDTPTTLYNEFFSPRRFRSEPWYGGNYRNNNENSYQRISVAGMKFLFLHLRFNPSSGAVDWARDVVRDHPDHYVIMTTHWWLDREGGRPQRMEEIYQRLVRPSDNLNMVLCGHLTVEKLRTDRVGDRKIHQMIADYQGLQRGGDGWLRILKFVPDRDRVEVSTYSPSRDEFQRDSNSEFSIDYPMEGSSVRGGDRIATVRDVESGDTVSARWDDLRAERWYEWYVRVTDADGNVRESRIWGFRTGDAAANRAPTTEDLTISLRQGESADFELAAEDEDGDSLTYEIVLPPSNGELDGEAPRLTYRPRAGFSGEDSMSFRADDGEDESNVSSVFFEVEAVSNGAVVVSNAATEAIFLEDGRMAEAFRGELSLRNAASQSIWERATFRNIGFESAAELVERAALYVDSNDNGEFDAEDEAVASRRQFTSDNVLDFDALEVSIRDDAPLRYFVVLEFDEDALGPDDEESGVSSGESGDSDENRSEAFLLPWSFVGRLASGGVPVSGVLLAFVALAAMGGVLLQRQRVRRTRVPVAWCASIAALGLVFGIAGVVGCGGGGGSSGPDAAPVTRQLQLQLESIEVRDGDSGAVLQVEGLPITGAAFDV